jgi:hypothetical protein
MISSLYVPCDSSKVGAKESTGDMDCGVIANGCNVGTSYVLSAIANESYKEEGA